VPEKTVLRAIELRTRGDGFPFSLPVFDEFESLEFTAPVTFLVGENGCGKSTLLEIIGAALKLPSLGQAAVDSHPLMSAAVAAARSFRLVRSGPIRGGFFFRADDVTGFFQSVQRNVREHDEIAAELTDSIPEGWGRTRAVGMAKAQSATLAERYGEDPFARSHGELYLDLFRTRITRPGVYLMDEPETPLSPTSQIALIAILQAAVEQGSQFIVATHSPILMALPDAVILDVNESPPLPVAWDEVEHVSLTRAFLNHPDAFLRHL
jgi:predicted ATPase